MTDIEKVVEELTEYAEDLQMMAGHTQVGKNLHNWISLVADWRRRVRLVEH